MREAWVIGSRPVLVLANVGDMTAAAVVAVLARDRGCAGVEEVMVEELVNGATWLYRDDDQVDTVVRLGRGLVLTPTRYGAVFNRVRWLPPIPLARQPDRAYAGMEWYGLLLAWLTTFACPVVNPPSPRGLAGAERGPLEWLHLADAAGLPIHPIMLTTNARQFTPVGWTVAPINGETPGDANGNDVIVPVRPPLGPRPGAARPAAGPSSRHVVVIGDEVSGAPGDAMADGCRRLAALADSPLLGVTFVGSEAADAAWCVTAVNPMLDGLDQGTVERIAGWLGYLADGSGGAGQ